MGKSVGGVLPLGFPKGFTERILGLEVWKVLKASGIEVLHIFHKYTGSTAKILPIGT
jgi:hypothetical protein